MIQYWLLGTSLHWSGGNTCDPGNYERIIMDTPSWLHNLLVTLAIINGYFVIHKHCFIDYRDIFGNHNNDNIMIITMCVSARTIMILILSLKASLSLTVTTAVHDI